MKKNTRGFTLLELTAVVAIISILAAIAIPSYVDYLKRAQVTEGLVLANKLRLLIADYYAHTGRFPQNNLALGISESTEDAGKFVKNLVVDRGAIHIYFKNKETFGTLSLRPSLLDVNPPNNIINWTCGYAQAVANTQLIGENKTEISRNYLPRSCL
jgi:type IV pilus assembly protein PilA